MGIQKDAGEILIFIYEKYIENDLRKLQSEQIVKETGWNIGRVRRAVKYLSDMGLVDVYYQDKYDGPSPKYLPHKEESIGMKRIVTKSIVEWGYAEFLKSQLESGNEFFINKLYPKAIDIIEGEKQEFKTTFGFEIGIPGMFKFSWKKEDK